MDDRDLNESVTNFFGFTLDQFLLRLFYLALSFPLGLFYFIFLVTGVSLGIGLAILWIGFLILAFVLAASWALTGFERQLAISLLGAEIPQNWKPAGTDDRFWSRIRAYIGDPATWKGLLFLFLKFPFGVATFVITVNLVVIPLALIVAPIVYPVAEYDFHFWYVQSFDDALLCSLAGVLIGFCSIYILNGLAVIWREFSVLLLDGSGRTAPVEPDAAPVVIQ